MSQKKENDDGVYVFSDIKLLSADVKINAEASSYLLPKPLKFSEPATATFFFADYAKTMFGSVYQEAAVLFHVVDKKGRAVLTPWIVVNEDTALISGREDLGTPKKMAEITLVEDGDMVTGTVIRRGIEVLRIETTLGASVEDPHSFASYRHINPIGMPAIGMKLYEIPPVSERIHQARKASGTLTVNPSGRDQLNVMKPAHEIDGQYLLLDFGIPGEGVGMLSTDVDQEWIARNFWERRL